jgi:hypothetical protein
MKRAKKKASPAAVAVAVIGFAGCLWFVVRGSFGSADGGNGNVTNEASALDVAGVDGDVDGEQEGPRADVPWIDLLAVHGSWSSAGPVRLAFDALPGEAMSAAAPAGEMRPASIQRWIGDDPPMLALGVVLVSEKARRAVVAGQVVGVGDVVGQARVMKIERGAVTLWWRGRALTYGLDGEAPFEFRAEQERRESARSRDENAAAGQ